MDLLPRTQVERKQKTQDSGEKVGKAVHNPAEKPVSLHPLEFEEAVKGLLSTKKDLATTRKRDS